MNGVSPLDNNSAGAFWGDASWGSKMGPIESFSDSGVDFNREAARTSMDVQIMCIWPEIVV